MCYKDWLSQSGRPRSPAICSLQSEAQESWGCSSVWVQRSENQEPWCPGAGEDGRPSSGGERIFPSTTFMFYLGPDGLDDVCPHQECDRSSTLSLVLHVVWKAVNSSRRNQHFWTRMRKWKLAWPFPGRWRHPLPFPESTLLWFWYSMIFIFKPNQDWQKLCMKNCLLLRSNLQAYLLYFQWTASLYAILKNSCLKVCVYPHTSITNNEIWMQVMLLLTKW